VRFVGWDWASTSHDVTVLDDQGRVLERWALRPTEQALAETLARLARHGQPAHLPVIMERSAGLVVDRLLAAGHPVVPVHPTAFHAARPRWGAAGAKSDPGDSYKLADYLRTDGHRLRRLQPLDPGLRELQALVRLREDHVRARTAASNQLGRCWTPTGPDPRPCSASWPATSRWPSWPPIQPPSRPSGSATPAWPGSAAATPTGAASHPPSSWPGCAQRRSHRSGWPLPCSPSWSPPRSSCCRACRPPSASRRQPSSSGSPSIHEPSSYAGCPGSAPSTWPSCWPRSVPSLTASAPLSRPPPNRRSASHQGLRQDQRRLFPLGGQPSGPHRPHRLRPQRSPAVTLGRPAVRRRPRPRQTQPTRHPHRRPRLAPGHLGLLAHRHAP
jgi:Transposase